MRQSDSNPNRVLIELNRLSESNRQEARLGLGRRWGGVCCVAINFVIAAGRKVCVCVRLADGKLGIFSGIACACSVSRCCGVWCGSVRRGAVLCCVVRCGAVRCVDAMTR